MDGQTLIIIKSVANKQAPDLTEDGDEEFVPPSEIEDGEKKALDISNPWVQAGGLGIAGAGAGYGIGSLLDRWKRSRKLKKLQDTGMSEQEAETEVARSSAMNSQASEAQSLAILLGLGGAGAPLAAHYAPVLGKKIRESMNKDRPILKIGSAQETVDRARETVKRAQAVELGVRRSLSALGVAGRQRQDMVVKVAFQMLEGNIRTPLDTIRVLKQAYNNPAYPDPETVEPLGGWGKTIGDKITEETKDLSPTAKFLLLTLGGSGLGVAGGALGDKGMEMFGRRPSNALTLLGALTGGGLGALKHISDQTGPLPG